MNTMKTACTIQLPTDPSYYGSACPSDRVEQINDNLESMIKQEFSDRLELVFERTATPRGNGILCEDESISEEVFAWIQENWTSAL